MNQKENSFYSNLSSDANTIKSIESNNNINIDSNKNKSEYKINNNFNIFKRERSRDISQDSGNFDNNNNCFNKNNSFINKNHYHFQRYCYNRKNNRYNISYENNHNSDSQKNVDNIFNRMNYISIEDNIEKIIDIINSNNITIINDKTGYRKLIKIAQLIYGSNNQNYILVTQPSDIATIGLSKIIANDLKEKVGNKVGYQTKWKDKFSNNTKIFIKNISIFLEELINEKINYTHIILDEIQENDNNMDLVLTLLKMQYKSNNNQKFLKLILLTRILNNNIFLDYFIDVNQSPISIIKFNDICYEIKTFYLNNIYMEIIKDRNIPKELSEKINKKLDKFNNYFDNIENINEPKFMKELYNIVIGIIEQKRINISFKENKRILILLPGFDEINFLNYKLQSYFENNEISEFYDIIIFHELIDDNEQKKYF